MFGWGRGSIFWSLSGLDQLIGVAPYKQAAQLAELRTAVMFAMFC